MKLIYKQVQLVRYFVWSLELKFIKLIQKYLKNRTNKLIVEDMDSLMAINHIMKHFQALLDIAYRILHIVSS